MPASLQGGLLKQIPVLLPNQYTAYAVTVPASGSFTFTSNGLAQSGLCPDIVVGTNFSLYYHDGNGYPHCVSATCTAISTAGSTATITATVVKFWSAPGSSNLYVASPAGPDSYPTGAFFSADAYGAWQQAFAQAALLGDCEIVGSGDFCTTQTIQPTTGYAIRWTGGIAYPCGSTVTHPFYYSGQVWDGYAQSQVPHILPGVSSFLNGGPTISDVTLAGVATVIENVVIFVPLVEWCMYGRTLAAGGNGNFGCKIAIGEAANNLYSWQIQSLTGSTDGVQACRLTAQQNNNNTNYGQFVGPYLRSNASFSGAASGSTASVPYTGTCPLKNNTYVVVQDGAGHGFIGLITGGVASSPLQVKVSGLPGNQQIPLSQLCYANSGLFPGTSSSFSYPSGTYVSAYNYLMGGNSVEDDEANGDLAGTSGITVSGGVFDTGNTVRIAGSFGAFDAGKFIRSLNGGMITSTEFDLALNYVATAGSLGYSDFAGLTSNIPGFNNSNRIRVIGMPRAPLASYAAQTAQGAAGIAAFNGGVPLAYNIVTVALTFATSLAVGATRSFYVYSPFALGNAAPRVTLNYMTSTGSIIIGVQDATTAAALDGNKYANQFCITVTAVGAAVPAGSSALVDLEFGH